MSVLEEIKRMREEGKSDKEIASSLKEMGLSDREIPNVLSQAKIKAAVFNDEPPSPQSEENIPSIMDSPHYPREQSQEDIQEEAHEPSESPELFPEIQSPSAKQAKPSQQSLQPQNEQGYYQSPMSYQESYPSYQAPALSSDTISEIAEEVVAEKLYPLRNELEKIIEFKTSVESRIAYLEERFKRIESIIDKLQLSLIQRVSEYVTDVGDIKKELVENQKSFKALLNQRKN